MKKISLYTHAGWGAVALATFWLGGFRESLSSKADATSLLQAERLADTPGSSSILGKTVNPSPDGEQPLQVRKRLDVNALATEAIRDPNPIKRRLAFSRLLEAMTPDNALKIREQLVALGTEGDQWRDFNYRWGAIAGEEAFTFASTSKERDLGAALAGWASENPNEALAMLDNLPEGMEGQRAELARSVVEGLSDRDLRGATDLVIKLAGEGVEKTNELMGMVAGDALRVEGVEKAAAWSETLPDGNLKGAAMQRIARDFAQQDPEAAASWAESVADQDYAAGAIEEIGDRWTARNPVAAVTWLESLPEGNGQKAGLSSAFGDWEDRDPAAATEHLASMPESPQRDSAISGFSRGYAWQDPEVAIAWALDISDPSLREESLTRAGQVFLRRDAESARAWLDSSGLPAETQNAILNARP